MTDGLLSEELVSLPAAEVVPELAVGPGRPLVAFISDLSGTKAVREWSCGFTSPPPEVDFISRVSLRALRSIRTRYPDDVARAWFIGMNHHLPRRTSPAEVLRDLVVLGRESTLDDEGLRMASTVCFAAFDFAND